MGALEGASPAAAGAEKVANSAYRKPPRVLRDALLRAGAELNLKPHQLLARVAPSPRRVAGARVPPYGGMQRIETGESHALNARVSLKSAKL